MNPISCGSIIFVHGTGVRLKDYRPGFDNARKVATMAGIAGEWIECAWGDALGVEFTGKSLPDSPSPEHMEEEGGDFARWNCLYADPLFELSLLTIRDSNAVKLPPMPGRKPEWEILWDSIVAYQPTLEFRLLLERGALGDYWAEAWSQIVRLSPIPRQAFEASAHELAEASHALARALVAQLYVNAVHAGVPGPSRMLREKLLDRLVVDWNQKVYGLGAFFVGILQRAATRVLRSHRQSFSQVAALLIGDILLYQSRGEEVRRFIREKIEQAKPPVTLVAHSLGGIACVDLLALCNPPKVDYLVTAGSQSPLLYELGALFSLKPPAPLPENFPPWLNFYDRNDFLSYVAGRLWPKVSDIEIESGQPFPDAHSAYFGNEEVWRAINQFIGP
ncbi:MAG: hypothetical protein U1F76_14130 [Candidatus Competibacteraceae bacterium]